HQIALVFPVGVVGDDHHPARRDRLDGAGHLIHESVLSLGSVGVAEPGLAQSRGPGPGCVRACTRAVIRTSGPSTDTWVGSRRCASVRVPTPPPANAAEPAPRSAGAR